MSGRPTSPADPRGTQRGRARQTSRSAAWVLASCLVACGAEAPGPVADAAEEVREVFLSEQPIVSIGTTGGEPHEQLYDVRDAARMSNGILVIANRGTSELRLYGPDGAHLRSVGREGDGPGEFQSLLSAAVIQGDTIVAWDGRADRISFFSPEGEYVSGLEVDLTSVSLSLAGRRGMAQPAAVHPLYDGTLIIEAAPPIWLLRGFLGGGGFDRDSVAPPGVHQADVPLLLMDRTGQIRRTLGTVPGSQWYVAEDGAQQPLLFGDRGFVVSGPTTLYAGGGSRWSYRVAATAGVGDEVVVSRPRLPFAEEVWTSVVDQIVPGFAEPDEVRRFYATMPRPDSSSAYSAMRVDADDNVWLEEYAFSLGREPHPSRWFAFSPNGDALWSLRLPVGMDILSIGRDEIVVLVEDELDIERVQAYSLRR